MLKNNLLMTFMVTAAVVGSVAFKSLPITSKYPNPIKISQLSSIYKQDNSIKKDSKKIAKKENKKVTASSNKSNSVVEDNTNTNNNEKNVINNQNSNNNEDIIKKSSVISESNKEDSNVNTNKENNINFYKENANNEAKDKQLNNNSEIKKEIPSINYDRTTSIYENDNKTLIRVEYYLNNKLVYYSDIEDFDFTTKSYIEKIYQYDFEKEVEYLIRTDKYYNGKLIKSW